MASDHVDALNQAGEDRTSEPRSSASCLQAASSREKTKKCKVFVGNISFYVTKRELAEFFSGFGAVEKCYIACERHRRHYSKGYGCVTFHNAESAELAVQAKEEDLILDGRAMSVSRSQRPRNRPRATCAKPGSLLKGEHQPRCHGDERATEKLVFVEESSDDDKCVCVLNDDALLHVFSYLRLKDCIRIERVCRRWFRVARLSWQFRKKLELHNTFNSFRGKFGALTDRVFHSILKRTSGSSLESLNLSGTPNALTAYSLDLIASHCGSGLVSLDLTGVRLSNRTFQNLTKTCKKLKWLTIRGCNAGEKHLWWALHNCNQLEYLNISGNRRLVGQCFFMAGNCSLKTVVLNECSMLSDVGMGHLLGRSPTLEVLRVSQCTQLTGASILNATRHCSELKELDISGPNRAVESRHFAELGKLSKLEVLSVDKQVEFTDEALSAICRGCSRLRHLSCEGCHNLSDGGISHLSSLSHSLTHLSIGFCHQITDEGARSLASLCFLERLVARACQALTDQAICLVVEKCPHLCSLDLSGCMRISDRSLYFLRECLLHMKPEAPQPTATMVRRERRNGGPPSLPPFSLYVGGTAITGEEVWKFAEATGAFVSQQDLSVQFQNPDAYLELDMAPWLCDDLSDEDGNHERDLVPLQQQQEQTELRTEHKAQQTELQTEQQKTEGQTQHQTQQLTEKQAEQTRQQTQQQTQQRNSAVALASLEDTSQPSSHSASVPWFGDGLQENWDDEIETESEPHFHLLPPPPQAQAHHQHHHYQQQQQQQLSADSSRPFPTVGRDFRLDAAKHFLDADDPIAFSDEFSDPEWDNFS